MLRAEDNSLWSSSENGLHGQIQLNTSSRSVALPLARNIRMQNFYPRPFRSVMASESGACWDRRQPMDVGLSTFVKSRSLQLAHP